MLINNNIINVKHLYNLEQIICIFYKFVLKSVIKKLNNQ